jgi:2-dehydropantoate 2-reductase
MRICVVGAGAIGGVIASGLASSGGTDVSVLARGATLAAIRSRGLIVESADGAVTVKVTASDDAAELGPQDFVVIAVKAQALPAAAGGIGPLLAEGTAVLSTLNGVPWWFFDGFGGPMAGHHLDSVDPGGVIAAAMPASRVIGGTVHMSASSREPGVVWRQSGNGLIIGEPSGAETARLAALTGALRDAGFDVTVSPRIHADVWYKLWGNLTMNPVSAVTGATMGPVLADELVVAFCSAAMLEAREIGARIGCPIAETPDDRHAVTRKLGDFRPSMLQDAEAGRSLELDSLTGAVREIGAIVGVPTPYVDALHGLTRLSVRVREARNLRLERRLIGGGQAQHGADDRRRRADLRLQGAQPHSQARLGIVTGEVDVADHEQHLRPDHLQPQVRHPGDLRGVEQGPDSRRAHVGIGLLADQVALVAVDQDDRDDAEQHADQDRPHGVRHGGTGQLVDAEPGRRNDHADHGSGVFREHRPQRGIGGGQHVVDEVPLHRVGLRLRLPDRLQERRSLQDEGNGQHDVPDEEVAARFGPQKLPNALRDRYHRARDEQAERGEQRPHVRFAAVALGVGGVGRPAGPAVGQEQEDLIA